MHKQQSALITKDGVSYLIPFILVTFCFALWGFANDITNPMVKAFSKIFRMNVTEGALVQPTMAIAPQLMGLMGLPASMLITVRPTPQQKQAQTEAVVMPRQ